MGQIRVRESNTEITLEDLRKSLPKRMFHVVNEDTVHTLNNIVDDDDFREAFRDNLMSYSHIIKSSRYSLDGYLSALKFASLLLVGAKHRDAYEIVFPEKVERLLKSGYDENSISSYVSSYRKGKMVCRILEEAAIPTHILNADLYQKALNRQAYLMMNARSETVQQNAADSLLTQLKPPETKKIEMDIGVSQDSSIRELRQATLALAAQQREMLKTGDAHVTAIVQSDIIEGEIIDN